MDIEIKKTVNEEVKVKYFCVDAVPRYWEDGDYNGKEDIPWEEQENGAKPMMPLAVENDDPKKNRDESYKLVFKIDWKRVLFPSGLKEILQQSIIRCATKAFIGLKMWTGMRFTR